MYKSKIYPHVSILASTWRRTNDVPSRRHFSVLYRQEGFCICISFHICNKRRLKLTIRSPNLIPSVAYKCYKQYRHWKDAANHGVWPGSTLIRSERNKETQIFVMCHLQAQNAKACHSFYTSNRARLHKKSGPAHRGPGKRWSVWCICWRAASLVAVAGLWCNLF